MREIVPKRYILEIQVLLGLKKAERLTLITRSFSLTTTRLVFNLDGVLEDNQCFTTKTLTLSDLTPALSALGWLILG